MAGTSWPTLTAGAIARSSDVNAHFAWLEGHLVPMSGGAATDLIFDLGTSTARWNFGYIDKLVCHNINPTTTTKCIVVGTTTACTTTADSDASIEFSGIRSVILPRLSTTQIGNLTSVDGMIAYNTSTGQFQGRKAGAWVNLGGSVYKAQIAVTSFNNTPNTGTALNITSGGGRINGIYFKNNNASAQLISVSLILDGVTIFATTTVFGTTSAQHAFFNGAGMLVIEGIAAGDTTTVLQQLQNVNTTTGVRMKVGDGLGSFDFASTAAVYVVSNSTITANISYSIIQ